MKTGILYKYDAYVHPIPIKHRLRIALRILFKGVMNLEWMVRADKKRKGLYIKGEKKDL